MLFRSKKVNAVKNISKAYSQQNIEFIHERIEKVYFDKPSLISMKAVGEVTKMLKLINSVSQAYILFYKAKNFEELEPNFKNVNGFEFVKIKKYNIGNNERCFVLYRKIKDSPKDNSLVKLSEFVFN